MALPRFFNIAEATLSNDGYTSAVKLLTAGKSAFGGTVHKSHILPDDTGGSVSVGHGVGSQNSAVYNAKSNIYPKMALLYNAHGGFVTPDYERAVSSTDQPFNFAGVALTTTQEVQDLWIRKDSTINSSPPARELFSAAYMTSIDKTIIFGGVNGITHLNDTWAWNGSVWTELLPASSPSARKNFSIVYDSVREVLVLFGGFDEDDLALGDTWEFDGANWSEISTGTSPDERGGFSLFFDPISENTILFGGNDEGATFGDTWEYDGSDWTEISPTSSPTSRSDAGAVFDTTRNVAVLFGGLSAPNTTQLNGTITAVATTIIVDSTSGFPATGVLIIEFEHIQYSGITGTTFTGCVRGYDGTTSAIHVDNTSVVNYIIYGDTWEYDGTTWTQVFIAGTLPEPRVSTTLVYNSTEKVVVLFGGVSNPINNRGDLDDTWHYNGAEWIENNSFGPSSRASFGFTYDGSRDRSVLFGGKNTALTDANSETWEFGSILRPVVIQTTGDVYVFYDANTDLLAPVLGDFLGPSFAHGSVTPVSDGYSPVFGIAVSDPLEDPNDAPNPLLIDVDGNSVGIIKMRIRPFYGFIAPLPPSITNFAPSSGYVGDTVRIDGTVFIGTSEVTIDSNDGYDVNASFSVISNNQIRFIIPAGAQQGTITITNQQGDSTSIAEFTTLPQIVSVEADTYSVGSDVAITGNTFTYATSLSFNGTDQPSFTIVNDGYITTDIPSGATTGDIELEITYPSTDTFIATYEDFQVVAQPTISNISPTTGPVGSMAYTTLDGAINASVNTITVVSTSGFVTTGTIVIGSEQITYTTTTATEFQGCVRGANSTTAASHLSAAPVSSLNVNPLGYVSITGTGFFVPGDQLDGYGEVNFIDVATETQILPATRTIYNDTTISVIVPNPGISQPLTNYYIQVITDGGVATSSQEFSLIPTPKFLPAASTQLDGGINSSVATITVDTTDGFLDASNFFIEDEQISYTGKTSTTFTGCVRGVNGTIAAAHDTGTDVETITFISSINTSNGIAGQVVRIFGEHGFTGLSRVTLGGYASPNIAFINDGYITAVIPNVSSAEDLVGPISVTSTGGTKSTADAPSTYPINFTILQQPVITSFLPVSGKVGDTISIYGNNFLSVETVLFETDGYASFSVINNNQINATVPASGVHVPTAHITLVKGPFIVESDSVFTFYPQPVISSIASPTPSGGYDGGWNVLVSINGSELTQQYTQVQFGNGAIYTYPDPVFVPSASPSNVVAMVPYNTLSNGVKIYTAGGVALI